MILRTQQSFQHVFRALQALFQQSWLLRWILANIAGWSIGLLLAAFLLNMLGIFGALIGGAAAGFIVGMLQAVALQTYPSWQIPFRTWVLYSILGGVLATVPIYLLAFGLLFNFNITLLLMGAIFGIIQSSLQARLLWHSIYEKALWWIAASAIGGALCAPLSLSASSLWLPVCFSPGPLIFGLITGIAFLKIAALNYASSDD